MNTGKNIRLLLAFLCTPFLSFATSYYVNDASLTGDVYTSAIGNDTNAGTTSAPFATLGYALSIVTNGDVIYIDAGNYNIGATITVTKAVNIYGPNSSLSGYATGRTTEAQLDFSTNPTSNLTDLSIAETVAAIEIKGLTIHDDISTFGTTFNRNGITIENASAFDHLIQNNIFERNNSNLNTNTKNSNIYAVFIFPANAITIDNNYFHGLSTAGLFNNSSWRSGIWDSPNAAATIITNNRFLNMRACMNVNINPSLVISGNDFQLGNTGLSAISTGGPNAGSAYTLAGNNFSGYGLYIGLLSNYTASFVMDATANTYNGNTFASLGQADALAVEASLKHGNMAGLNGFIKIKPGNVYVTPSANGDAPKFIQSTIDNFAQAGDIVNIGSYNGSLATFAENIKVNKSVTLLGQGQSTTVVVPSTSNPNCNGGGTGSLCAGGTAASSIILVQANNVSVKNLTVDGDNTALTSGQVFGGADINARNGIITDSSSAIVYSGLTIDNVNVKNIFLKGIYASTGGSFTFSNNTVTNVQAGPLSVAISNNGGAGSFINNTVSNSTDAISSNLSKGSIYNGNTITNSGSGIHTDNNGGLGGIADVIQNNTVSNSPAGGYGIFVLKPFVATTVTSNTITNVETGLANFGQNAAVTPTFTGNFIDGQNKANATGVLQTTDQPGSGSNNVSGTFTNNYIKNNNIGIAIIYQTGNTNDLTANYNNITGNNIGVKVTAGGTLTSNFDCNWWGVKPEAAVIATIGAPVTYSKWLSLGTDNDPSISGFQPLAGACDQVLPIVFSYSLNGIQLANANKLQWAITTSADLNYFELQKSSDGINFQKIALIYPTANNNYNYADDAISGNSYYRLRSVEHSGQVSYSNIVLLSGKTGIRTIIRPSLFTSSITIIPSALFTNKINITMYNTLGAAVLSKNISTYRTGEIILLNDLDRLPAGVYNIVLQTETQREAIMIIK